MLFQKGKKKEKEVTKENETVVMEKKRKHRVPKTVQDSIPYDLCFDNGVMKLSNDTYCKTYSFEDINFKDEDELTQYDISDKLGKFFNIFSPQMSIQISLFNRQIDESVVLNEVLVKPQPDNYNGLREAVNDIIKPALLEGDNNLKCEKYFTVSLKARSREDAMRAFRTLDANVKKNFQKIEDHTSMEPLSIDKKLSLLYDIYNPYSSMNFERKYQSTNGFSLEQLRKIGWSTKDIIGCPSMKFNKDYIELGDNKVARVFCITNFPESLSSDFVIDVASRDCSALTSVFLQPLDAKKITFEIRNKLTDINKDMSNAQKKASNEGYDSSLVSANLQNAQESGNEFFKEMSRNGQNNYLVTMQITLFAHSLEELEIKTENLRSTVAKYVCDVKTCIGQLEPAFNSVLPLAQMQIKMNTLVQTEQASIFLPFSYKDIIHQNGIFYGKNQGSGKIIRINKKFLTNMNKAFLGKSGSGKSVIAKWDIVQTMLTTNDDVFIIDPDNEYLKIAAMFPDDAEVIHLKPGAQYYINPLDLDISDNEDGSPIATKESFLFGLMSIAFGEHYILSPVQKSILHRCAYRLYEPYIAHLKQRSMNEGREITIDYEAAPTLVDLFDMLMNMGSPEAAEMGNTLEMLCTGDNAIFAKKTNINPKKRMIVYDVKDLGILKQIGIFICNYHAWTRTISNKYKGINTDTYIDEFHVLMSMPEALADVANMYARERKFGGSMSVITQNITPFFNSTDALRILENTSLLFLLKQGDYEKEKLAELYSLSDNEKKYLSSSPFGTGLIKVDNDVYPFENLIPKESPLYEPLNTKA